MRSRAADVAAIDNITLAVGGYSGKLGKEPYGTPVFHTATRLDALAAYTADNFRVGAEYYEAKNWTAVA